LGINAEPINHFIHRWEKAIPQYHLGHLERLQRIDTRLSAHPGLFLTGNALRGVAINDCTADAQRTAQLIVEYFRNAPSALR
jgi:oxygen-dependent protoporphyrinogen oxidase